MKNMSKLLFVPLLISVVFLGCLNVYISRSKSLYNSSVENLLSHLPLQWSLNFRDSTNCHIVNIKYNNKYEGEVEEYINTYVFGGKARGKVVDLNSFDINSSNVVDMGQQGVGNIATLYIKSSSANIYIIEVNSAKSETELRDFKSNDCTDLKLLIQPLVKTLLQS